MKKKSVMMMFCLILVLALTGCRSKKETNDQSNQKEGEKFMAAGEKRKNIRLKGSQIQKVQTLLGELQKTPKSQNIRSVIPKRIVINSFEVNSNIVQVDFSMGYKRIAENKDLICRAGIVYTLTQLKGINYVSFSISGEPMLDTDGTALGALGRDSFVFDELPMK